MLYYTCKMALTTNLLIPKSKVHLQSSLAFKLQISVQLIFVWKKTRMFHDKNKFQ